MRYFGKTKPINKFYLSLVISYVMTFIIPLMIGFGGLALFFNLLNKQVVENNRLSLYRLRNLSDAYVQNLQVVGNQLIFNSNIEGLKYATRPFSAGNLIACWDLQRDLNVQAATNSMIDGIYVTFKQSGMILSTDGLYRSEDFEKYLNNEFGFGNDKWNELLSFAGNTRTSILPLDSDESTPIVICKDSNQPDKGEVVSITIVLNSENFGSLLDSLRVEQGSDVFVHDLDQNVLASSIDLTVLQQVELINDEKARPLSIAGKKYWTISMPSQFVKDWHYQMLVPQDIFSRQLSIAWILLAAYLLIGLIIGAYLIPRSIKKQYTPVKQLLNTFIGQLNLDDGNDSNEFVVIENGLSELLHRSLNNEKLLFEHRQTLAHNALTKMMTGPILSEDTFRSICAVHGIILPHPGFIVCLFTVDDYGKLLAERYGANDDQDLNLIHFVIRSTINEVIQQKYPCQTVEIDEMIACLVNFERDDAIDPVIHDLSLQINEFLQEKFEISLSAGIGRMKLNALGIGESYQEAKQVIDYIQMMDLHESVLSYGTIIKTSQPNVEWFEAAEFERRFINAMLTENYQDAKSVLQEMITTESFVSGSSLAEFNLKKTLLVNMMTLAQCKLAPTTDCWQSDKKNPINKLDSLRSVSEIRGRIDNIFEHLIQSANEQRQKTPTRQDDILNYVKEHFTEPDFSISAIGDHFNISTSQVSRSFKGKAGMGLLDYVHHLRIEVAKDLLKTTALSIKDISIRVGYVNSLTMTRAFRRYEGVTPSDFREVGERQ